MNVFQVARLSAKDSGYLLRDDFYRLVQKDWPGYSEEERQLLGRLLARLVQSQEIRKSASLCFCFLFLMGTCSLPVPMVFQAPKFNLREVSL